MVVVLLIQALVFAYFCCFVAEQKNRGVYTWFALGFFFSIVALLAIVGLPTIKLPSNVKPSGEKARGDNSSPGTLATSPQAPFDGKRDITIPGYQLFLTKCFGIEKNNTLDKFVIGNDVFDDLPAVLADADARYGQHLDELAAEALRLKREASALEQSRVDAAERDLAQAKERRAKEELRRIESAALAQEQEVNRKKAIRKAMPWALVAAVFICVVGGLLFRQHAIQEQVAREARHATEEAARLAWQSTGKVIKDCADCPEMVTIPAGSFDMGSGAGGLSDEQPLHPVKLQGFLLGRTEVTQGQWRAVMGGNPSKFKDCGDDCPVENVSWNDAQLFAEKLSQKTGKTYRLPSEAEWEYAARAGGRGKWEFGDDESQLGTHAWFSANSGGKTHPVGQKKASVVGLHEMHGNVWEWVQDNWHDEYKGAPSDGSAWSSGGDPELRVHRGGAWISFPGSLRSAIRSHFGPDNRYKDTGLRIARTL